MIRELCDWVCDLAPQRSEPVAGIVLGPDRSPSAKVVVLLLDRGGSPTVVVKLARDELSEAALHREHAMCSALHRGARGDDSQLLPGVPVALGLTRIGDRLAFAQTAVPGDPMTARYYRPGHTSNEKAVTADFTSAGGWLDLLHRRTGAAPVPLAEAWARWAQPVLATYRAEIGWDPVEAQLFAEVGATAAALGEVPVPLTAVHGDFWMGNLLIRGDTLAGVVDWECGQRAGLPFADVYKFPLSYGFYLDRSRAWDGGRVPGHPGREDTQRRWRRYGDWKNLIGFGHSWFGDGWLPRLTRTFVEQRFAGLGIPPAVNAVFFPVFLAQQAATLPDPDFRAGYRSLVHAFAGERSNAWLWSAE